MLSLVLALAQPALADTITLDTGANIEGDLARYELGGDCQISVTEGGLQGVIVIVPCHRVRAFVRVAEAPPSVLEVVEPEDAVAVEPEEGAEPEREATEESFPGLPGRPISF